MGNTDVRDLMVQIEKARRGLMQPYLQSLGLAFGQGQAGLVRQGFDRLNDVICEGIAPEELQRLKLDLERILKNLKECPGL